MFSIQTSSSEIKKFLGGFATPLLIGAVLSTFAFAFWYGVSGWKEWRSIREPWQMSVTGEGKITARPNVAIFTASVLTQAQKVKDAQNENSRRSNAIIEFLKKNGVGEKDIKTVGYNISPQYRYYNEPRCLSYPCPPQNPPEIASYQVQHTIEVKVRDLDKADNLLDGVVASGANEIGSIRFDIDDKDALLAKARKEAIEDAKGKARVLAQDLGVRLGKIVSFSESGSPIPIFARAAAEAKGGFGGGAAPAPEVEPGEQEIRSTVTITYEFK
jgi:hypothetical protein